MEMWPATKNEAAPLVAEAIHIFKKFRPEALEWLIPFVLESQGKGDWDTYVAMMRTGEPVSVEQKGAWGHEKWFVFCRPCWDFMTDAGRYEPREAIDELLQHVFWRQRLVYRRWQIADLLNSTMIRGNPFYEGISIRADELCCEASRKLNDQVFPVDSYPNLPLPDCDQVWCKCDWDAVRRKRQPAPTVEQKAHAAGHKAGSAIARWLFGKSGPTKD